MDDDVVMATSGQPTKSRHTTHFLCSDVIRVMETERGHTLANTCTLIRSCVGHHGFLWWSHVGTGGVGRGAWYGRPGTMSLGEVNPLAERQTDGEDTADRSIHQSQIKNFSSLWINSKWFIFSHLNIRTLSVLNDVKFPLVHVLVTNLIFTAICKIWTSF